MNSFKKEIAKLAIADGKTPKQAYEEAKHAWHFEKLRVDRIKRVNVKRRKI